jgi:hypothetical protein
LKAKTALEDGWRLLFSPHREALYGVSDILLEGEKSVPISEHKRIDLLRSIPTLTGWRLSEGSGWAINGYPGIFTYCALLYLYLMTLAPLFSSLTPFWLVHIVHLENNFCDTNVVILLM